MRISTNANNDEWSSVSMFRIVGYTLLLLAILDCFGILLAPGSSSPGWQIQVISSIIDRVPLPLIGLILVFSGETNMRKKWERLLLKGLSWFALVAGILLLGAIPVLITATVQTNLQTDAQVLGQVEQQSTQLDKLGQQVNEASPQDLEGFLSKLNQQGTPVPAVKDPQSLRTQLLKEVDQAQRSLKAQAETARSVQRSALLTNTVKWSLGALVGGVALIRIWQVSGWARRKHGTSYKVANI